jgi:hypothetical protein
MPDQRPIHRHQVSIYGPTGPSNALGQPGERPLTTTMRFAKARPGPPQSIQEHIEQCLSRVKGIGPRTKTALTHEIMRMCRDLDFLRQLTAAAKASGPWSEAAVSPSDEGRIL